MTKKKILPKIKAIAPEIAVAENPGIKVYWDTTIIINNKEYYVSFGNEFLSCYELFLVIREVLEEMYAFLNENLGTHYVVKNDTESNLADLGYG